MMYTYNFGQYSGASTSTVFAAGPQILLDVYDDPSTPQTDVLFRFRNVIDNGYDTATIVNVFFDTGAGDSSGVPLFTKLSVFGESAGVVLSEPGDLDASDLTAGESAFLNFDYIAFSPDFSVGRGSASGSYLGIGIGEFLTIRAVLNEGVQFSDVIDAMDLGLSDTYAEASQGLRIALLLHNVVPDSVEVDNHGLFVTGGLLGIAYDPGAGEDDNTLIGTALNDSLDGGVGADQMYGLAGDDVYVVDNFDDSIIEQPANGTDTIIAYVSTILPENVENLVVHAISGAGNELDNLIVASDRGNYLDGKAGRDTVSYATASGGVSVNLGTTVAQATGGSGNDILLNFENVIGSAFADTLTGNTGSNLIDGGAGADAMRGGPATIRISSTIQTIWLPIRVAESTRSSRSSHGRSVQAWRT